MMRMKKYLWHVSLQTDVRIDRYRLEGAELVCEERVMSFIVFV